MIGPPDGCKSAIATLFICATLAVCTVQGQDDDSDDDAPRHGPKAKCREYCLPHKPTDEERKQWGIEELAFYICEGACVVHEHTEDGEVRKHQNCGEHRRDWTDPGSPEDSADQVPNCSEYCRKQCCWCCGSP